jgi:ABC-2 type transport system permease protein
MFTKIFLFEVQTRIRRPAIYLYFMAILVFTLFAFSTGSLPIGDREHINSPYVISFWCCAMTMMMTLVSSSVMGTALFRDIEYQTKDYYLTYPITKPGYFWGRFCGSFVFMIAIALAIPLGIWMGTHLGPAIGKALPARYGPNKPIYYLYPFLVIALPNIFFTSALFYGLVAVLRNVKVIYFGGLLLFLFYFMALFFLSNTNNANVIGIADPFALNGVRAQMFVANYIQKNNNLVIFRGPLAINRMLWPGLSLTVLMITYIRFNFERYFAGRRDKAAADELSPRSNVVLKTPVLNFAGDYNRRTLGSLIRLELLNIIRDNYFWMIIGCGTFFLGFVFWMGPMEFRIRDLPRTVMFLDIFSDAFPFFIFFIIMFYCGETLQRDRLTRYAFINDALPPPNWVLNGSKLISLVVLSVGLAFLPMVVGVAVQLLKGYPHLNLSAYLEYLSVILLPKFLTGAVLCYVIQVIFNNKFAGYAVVVPLWVGLFFLDSTGTFNYRLLLYSFTPNTGLSDMDGMGHMVRPVSWYDTYWMLAAGLLIVVAALLYNRGLNSSLKERWQLIPERFNTATKWWAFGLIVLFLGVGGYIYYNVSYLNEWLTKGERIERAARYEKALKKYQRSPLPKMTRLVEWVDIYPEKKQEWVRANVTIANKTGEPIREMLLDGDELTDYSISIDGKPMPFSYPLMYPRGMFSWFRPAQDTAPFRLYRFPSPLAPGDTLVLELNTAIVHKGFTNELYAKNLLDNGTLFTGGLPGLGYDDDDELQKPYERKEAGLPPKVEEEIGQDDPMGRNTLKSGAGEDLIQVDITVSVPDDQTAVSQGELVREWKSGGRNYFHYILDKPGLYVPFAVVAARFTDRRDSVMLDHPVDIDVYYDARHGENVDRFMNAYKDGLRYFSKSYGSYPFRQFRLVESSDYGPRVASLATMVIYAEENMWNMHYTSATQDDYLYNEVTTLLAQQWWRYQVAPNNTVGSLMISEGLANYDGLMMDKEKYGAAGVRPFLANRVFVYTLIRPRFTEREHPLIRANEWIEWSEKAGLVLYGLGQLMGEDSLSAALMDFRATWAFRRNGPFAGANDLYAILKKHVPDSLQYYLTDTWQKVTLYDNKVEAASAAATGRPDEYKVTMRVNIDKVWIDDKGNDVPVAGMNDYIDIGVFGEPVRDSAGRLQPRILYGQRYRLTRGEHELNLVVKGKPKSVAVDPQGYLIDRNMRDNGRGVE